MKYLIIDGGTHKGNTWKLVELAKKELNRMDANAEFKEIQLVKEKIPFCCGCSKCFRIGGEKCPHHNVVGPILKAIEKADGVIFCSPTHNVRESGLVKNFFDHLCFLLHRPHFFTSKAFVITTTGGVGAKKAAKSIAASLKGIGFNRCHIFACAALSWNDFKPTPKIEKRLARKTDQFYRDVRSGKMHSPSTSLLIPYNLFRGMSLAYVPGTEYETADGAFWTSKERRKGVYDHRIPVPVHKKLIGGIFYQIGKVAAKKVTVTYKKGK